jgi:hypothetical protein
MKNLKVIYLVTMAVCLVIGHYSGRLAMRGLVQECLEVNNSFITLIAKKDSVYSQREIIWTNCVDSTRIEQ